MFALRSLARSLPRAALRVPKPLAPRITSFLAPKPLSIPKAFSTSVWRREPAGESDQVLSAKLQQEKQLEIENEHSDQIKAEIDDFLANSAFKVEDKPGTHQVVLSKTFGNEVIKIKFSVSDMNEIEEYDDALDQDNAFDDEGLPADTTSGGKRTINQSGVRGGPVDVAPEDSIAPSDGETDFDDQAFDTPYPLHLNITIAKEGRGATEIQAAVQSGAVEISQMSYYPQAELVDPKTPEQVREAQNVYEGPPFTSLDTDLQSMVLQYLEERGINAELAEFLPKYVDFKEQREYVQWLDDVKAFVDA